MDSKTSNCLLSITAGLLAACGLIQLLRYLFAENRDIWTLAFALMNINLANLFNIIRLQRSRRQKMEKNCEKEEKTGMD